MGLDCSYDAFHGAYSAFNRFRQVVCEAVYGSYPPHLEDRNYFGEPLANNLWYVPDGFMAKEENKGLILFLSHSDCDGKFSPDECVLVANGLERILPRIEEMNKTAFGHIEAAGGFVEVTKKFIQGCRKAAKLKKSMLFY